MQFPTDSPNQGQAERIPRMAHKRGGLLAQIEADLLDDRVPLSSLLQRCVVLGRQAESEKLRDWALWELNGYADAPTVPDYRHVHAALMAVITNNAGYNAMTQRIPEDVFPDQIRDVIRETIGDIEDAIIPYGTGMLEELASQGTDTHRLSPPFSIVMADTLNQFNMAPNSRVAQVYWSVSNASIRGILVRVRTALADRVAELITLTPQDQDVPDKQAAAQAVQLNITGESPTIHFGDRRAGDIVTHSSGSEYNFGPITGNVAAGSSDVTQNYNAGFDITKVREFADLVTEIAGLLGLEPSQQAELTAATAELNEAIDEPAANKGRMRRAVDAVMGYLKLAGSTALRNAAITAGDQAGSELDLAIRHMHL
jgi:AbiTii-like protein